MENREFRTGQWNTQTHWPVLHSQFPVPGFPFSSSASTFTKSFPSRSRLSRSGTNGLRRRAGCESRRSDGSFEQAARAAVAEAGERLRAVWRGRSGWSTRVRLIWSPKPLAIEALIVERLRHAFPDHLIVAEEASAGTQLQPPPADRYSWYLDPLDGTAHFAHGHPQFCVSPAFSYGAELQLGIVHDPVRDETWFAHRGRGATLNGEPIAVSPR